MSSTNILKYFGSVDKIYPRFLTINFLSLVSLSYLYWNLSPQKFSTFYLIYLFVYCIFTFSTFYFKWHIKNRWNFILLKYNLYVITFTHFEYRIHWFLVNFQSCTTITSEDPSWLIQSSPFHLQLLETTNVFSVPRDLPFLTFSYKWNHILCPLHLTSFTYCGDFEFMM